jgi:hypothetical protein
MVNVAAALAAAAVRMNSRRETPLLGFMIVPFLCDDRSAKPFSTRMLDSSRAKNQ